MEQVDLRYVEVKTIPAAWPSEMNTCGRIAVEASTSVRDSKETPEGLQSCKWS